MARLVLRSLLFALGALLTHASRSRPAFRAALSADRTVTIETDDGVARQFRSVSRAMVSESGAASDSDLRLWFKTSSDALAVLLSSKGIERLLDGMSRKAARLDGNLMLFVWFLGRIDAANPLARLRRQPDRFPGAYVRPRDDIEAARSITREAAAADLDPNWSAAARQRAKLLLIRVAAGQRAPEY